MKDFYVLVFLTTLSIVSFIVGYNFSLASSFEEIKTTTTFSPVEPQIVHLPKKRVVEPDIETIARNNCPHTLNEITDEKYLDQSVDYLQSDRKCYQQYLTTKIESESCKNPSSLEDFICIAKCRVEDPELDYSIRLHNMAEHSAEDVIHHCKKGIVPFIIWIHENNTIKYMNCTPISHKLGPSPMQLAKRLLYLVSCIVKLPSNLVIGFDPQDFALPTISAPNDIFHYIRPMPGIIRFVGTRAHESLLFPTGSHTIAMAHCNFRVNRWWDICFAHEKYIRSLDWKNRSDIIMWRGTASGDDWSKARWRFNQRALLVRTFKNRSGYDIGFTREIKTPYDHEHEMELKEEWVYLPDIPKENHPFYKYLLHVDGNTASWGLSHKLYSGSVVLWVQSKHDYREYFYSLLKPWVHYIPVAPDLSDLDSIRDWVLQNENRAFEIAQNAIRLIESRLRPQDNHCYVLRLLESISAGQRRGPRANETVMKHLLSTMYDEWKYLNSS